MPDWVAVSVGDGCTIAGIWKGLKQMHELGVIDRLPRLIAAQAAEVAPLDMRWNTIGCRRRAAAKRSPTASTCTCREIGGKRSVRSTKPMAILVTASDEAILDAMRMAGRHGVFAEPAAAASLAAVVVGDRFENHWPE